MEVEALWVPDATASPYQPLFIASGGGRTYFVSAGGDVFSELRNRLTGEKLDVAP
ncbi:MAG: hypothetical protein QOJ39_1469 [Candidatus Eremiobacteraeota bacterium]|jgi:hypothetical protein|nr:hypothetical protein [Candidatus Eremiobacteraeota bacterium]